MYGLFISRNEKNSRHVMPFRCVMWTRLIVQNLFRKKRHVITIIATITVLILNNVVSRSIMCLNGVHEKLNMIKQQWGVVIGEKIIWVELLIS